MMSLANNKIKVAMLTATYYPVWGGLQKQLSQIGKYLSKNNVEYFILTRRLPRTKKYEDIEGVPVYRIFITNYFKFLDSLCYTLFSLFWLIKNRSKFNILHCYQIYSPTTIGILTKLFLKKKKVIVKVTSSNEYGETSEIKRLPFSKVRIKLLKYVDKFLIVNQQIKNELSTLEIPLSRIEYLPNGVEIPEGNSFEDDIRQSRRSLLNLDFKKIGIFTGRITKEKNLQTLLFAWKEVSLMQPEAHLIILGEGGRERNTKEEIIQLRLRLGLEDKVHLLGMVENVFDYLLASDIFILSSISEGLSNSLLEAMAAGLGIIATDNDGNRELIKNRKNGLLVPLNNIEKLREAILTLFENNEYNKILGKNAKETVKQGFSLENIAKRYIECYRACLIKEE